MKLSPPMLRALALLAQHGTLHRLPGGLWVHDPEEWHADRRDAVSDPWVRVETLRALERRGMAKIVHSGVCKLTEGGRYALAKVTHDGDGT